MRLSRIAGLPLAAVVLVVSLYADDTVDCSRRSLAKAISNGNGQSTIRFTGICNESVVISTDRLTLIGVGTAVIDGGKHDAVTIAGVHAVSLSNFEVRNGLNGIIGTNGTHVSLSNLKSHDNLLSG